MFNDTSDHSLNSFGSLTVLVSILLSGIAIFVNLIIISLLICHIKYTHNSKKTHARHVGLLHSINTYIHLIGILSTLFIMCIRTLYGDLHRETLDESFISWHCHFLGYLLSLFGTGVYGACFLQALYRFWRIMLPNRLKFQSLIFNIQLIICHWLSIIILLIPIIFRSIYIISDHFCLSPFDDRWTALYISFLSVVMPVTGIFIIYIRIIIYMKNHLQSKTQWRRIRRDISIIRRILLLVIIILQTSITGIILWILTIFNNRLHLIFYRLLRFSMIVCMMICSITLLILSPQIKRAFRSSFCKQKRQIDAPRRQTSSTMFNELTLLENRSVSK